MAEAKKRKVHSAEFKAKVGLEAARGLKTVNEIAQQHGVHPVMVSQWKKEILASVGTLFEGKRVTRPMLNFKSFRSAGSVLAGIELMHMIRKGQFAVDDAASMSFAAQLYTFAGQVRPA